MHKKKSVSAVSHAERSITKNSDVQVNIRSKQQDQSATITIMENGNEHNYKTNDKQELAPLLLVFIDGAQTAKKSSGGKRFVALLLLLVVVTVAAAAAMMVLLNSSSSAGVNPIAPAVSSLLGTGRKKYESCASPWWNACGDKLSCYDPRGSRTRYCVPMGKENACCGYPADADASGIDCLRGLSCVFRDQTVVGAVSTCHPTNEDKSFPYTTKQAKNGICNVNTGEPATIFIEVGCGYDGKCRPFHHHESNFVINPKLGQCIIEERSDNETTGSSEHRKEIVPITPLLKSNGK